MVFWENFNPIAERNIQITQDSFVIGQRPEKFESRSRNDAAHALNDFAPVSGAFPRAPHPDKTHFLSQQTRFGRSSRLHQRSAPLLSQAIWLNDCRLFRA